MAQGDQPIFYRFRSLGEAEKPADAGNIELIASTDHPVSFGDWSEILSHEPGACDTEAARSLLINHDVRMVAGGIGGFSFADGQQICRALIAEKAKLETDIPVREAVRDGYLRGVSVGYTYESKDCVYDEARRTVTVRKWRLLEISLTPTPADAAARVRGMPTGIPNQPAAPAAKQKAIAMSENQNAAGKPDAANGDETARARELQETRDQLAKAQRENKLRALAGEHKVPVDGIDFASFKDEADGITELLKRKAEAEKTESKLSVVQVTRDATDKWIGGVQKGLMGERGGLNLSNEQIMRRCLEADGERVDECSIQELANLSLRRFAMPGKRDAANKTISSFSVLVGSTANKQLLAGFDSYQSIYEEICTIKDAKDYNSHPNVGVSTGRLTEVPENEAFPELFQKEGSYNSQLKMYGATLSISEQTLVNDTLGEILRSFYKSGYFAKRTIDRMVFYRLLNATWTNDVTTGAALGTAGNFDKVRGGFKKKLSPSNEKMDLDPAILVVDPVNRYSADIVTGQLYGIQAGAGNSQVGSNAARSLKVVDSTFVGDTGLYSGALTTDFYLFGNPKLVDTITVEFLNGQRTPEIEPFDAGAVAAVKMKAKLPFEATIATHTDGAATLAARVTGIQKGQA